MSHPTHRVLAPISAAALALIAGHALAQEEGAMAEAAPAPAMRQPQPPNGRKLLEGPPTKLAFKGVTVEQIVPFIVEATGKVVMPIQEVMTRRITVLNDKEIPRNEALDLVLQALQQNGIAVVETPTAVMLRDQSEINRAEVPVLGPDESVLQREDVGAFAFKSYRIRNSQAKTFGDNIKTFAPDFVKILVDEDSSQVGVMGNIGLLQRIEKMVNAMDTTPPGAVKTETFFLRYADAAQIAQNIEDLFSPNGQSTNRAGQQNRGNQRGQQNQQNQRQNFFPFQGQPGADQSTSAQTLRVSAIPQQNAVTVVADPVLMEQIRTQITQNWDKKVDNGEVLPRVYHLQYTDPVKVRAMLEGLFGRPNAAGSTQSQGGGGPGGGGAQGGGQPVGISSGNSPVRLANQFSFQALPDSQELVVIAKSSDNYSVIDQIIKDLDKPQTVGLPAIIELKHANAEDLAEQLNALLSQEGTLASVTRSASGLSTGTGSTSPFSQQSQTTTDAQGNTTTQQNTAANQIAFWWQRARPPTDRQSNSNLIGQVRIVPVWRQNALMVMAPLEYKSSVIQLVESLDQPGRQVLISSVIVEVQRDDALNLGLRWSSQAITPTNADNSVSIANSSTNTKNNFLPGLFDTTVLNSNVNLNVVLQALAQKTAVSILSEPKIFTSDNQEAEFFDGQDIPFITESQPNTQGNLVQSFDYKAVGIQLRARPRITVKHDVDLRVNVQLSSIVPGQTLFGGAIVDRRETTTQLIVHNGQTVVISGILRKEDSDIIRKVPILGDIPLLGLLFRSTDKTKTNTELLVFITPLVVDNDDDMARVNEPYRDRLDERRKDIDKGTPKLPAGSKPADQAVPKKPEAPGT